MPENTVKILVAEDDDAMRRFIEVTLTNAGYVVRSFEDGLAALEAAGKETFDIVVADAIMPVMSGYDLCRALGRGKLPCIILSGLEQGGTADDIADAFLVKDTNLKENLLLTLARVSTSKSGQSL